MVALRGFDWKLAEDGKSASVQSQIEVKVGPVSYTHLARHVKRGMTGRKR